MDLAHYYFTKECRFLMSWTKYTLYAKLILARNTIVSLYEQLGLLHTILLD
jgi:hypothetical protein